MSKTHDTPDAGQFFDHSSPADSGTNPLTGLDSSDLKPHREYATQPQTVHTDSGLNALAVALHVPASLQGLAIALDTAVGCLSIAAQHHEGDNFSLWNVFAQQLQKHIRTEAANGSPETSTWFQPLPQDGSPLSRIGSWRLPIAPSENEKKLSTLLGRAIAVSATLKTSINPALINGLHILRNAYMGKGRRSAAWDTLTDVDLLDTASMQDLYEQTDPRAIHTQFISAALAVLRSPIGSPNLQSNPVDTRTAHQEETLSSIPEQPTRKARDSDTAPPQNENQSDKPESWTREELEPDIAARLASSDYTDFGQKLGFVTWDHIAPDDLKLITRRLAGHLKEGDRKRQIIALFHLISLLTGCTDFIALKLEFQVGNSIWIDICKGCWCWDFKRYRSSDERKSCIDTAEPICIALPVTIARWLRELYQQAPDAKNLRELMAAALGEDLDLEASRAFLRADGSTAHPAFSGRFARSMPFVFLKTSGSDMTAAMLSGHFATAAPASLFYFGPTHAVLHERLSNAYSFLGLDLPEALRNGGERAGCQKVLEPSLLQTGWQQWQAEVKLLFNRVTSNETEQHDLEVINRLMILLCAGFVIQTAHRGTRLDRLTFGAMFLMEDALLNSDKEQVDREQPRLIGKTETVKTILLAAASLHSLIRPDKSTVFAHDECLFVTWKMGHQITSEPLTTGAIAEVTSQFFKGSDANFGRSAWVTHLDEDGYDRWLIRVLTGHTRDVTRTHGAYFDISPMRAAKLLAVAMEDAGHRLFGAFTLPLDERTPTVVFHSLGQVLPQHMAIEFTVPDPRSVLEPLAVSTLAGWRATSRVRKALLDGRINAAPACLATLHMLFVDLAPAPYLCISVHSEPNTHSSRYGCTSGLSWQRPHFVHSTWLSQLAMSTWFLHQAQQTRVSEAQLCLEIVNALRSFDQDFWPGTVDACIGSISNALRAFLRLQFPPSLLTVSSNNVPSPTLSPLSMLRLAARTESHHPIAATLTVRPHKRSTTRTDDLKQLRRIISEQSSQTTRLGELRQRALNSLALIRQDFHPESAFSGWVADWVVDELQRSAQGDKGRLDISSIGTYLSVLTHQPKRDLSLDQEDPYEWSEDQWLGWIHALDHDLSTSSSSTDNSCDAAQVKSAGARIGAVCGRVHAAINRLVRNLIKREQWIPHSVRRLIAETGEQLPGGSASSTLVTRQNLNRANQIASEWLADEPLNCLLVKSRAEIQFAIPTRSADISNLQVDCLTSNGMLVIERVGYKNIKNDNSIRTIQTSPILEKLILEHRHELLNYIPQAKFLFRLEGRPEDGMRDINLIGLMSAALKAATGDISARPHSLRSSALQNLAWAGWTTVAHEILTGQATPTSCAEWITHDRWTGLAEAAYMAGHGDLRPALGNYLSGWNMVYSAHVMALLAEAPPQPGLLRQLGIDPAGLRKFRQRAAPGTCEWGWVFSQLRKKLGQGPEPQAISCPGTDLPDSSAPKPVNDRHAPAQPREESCDIQRDIQYLSSRILGMPKPQALEKMSIGLGKANELDRLIPPLEFTSLVSRRARESAQARGLRGNLDVLFSDQGRAMLDWITSIDAGHRNSVARMVFKLEGVPARSKDLSNVWRALVQHMPSSFLLKFHRGEKYLGDAEHSFFISHSHCVLLKVDGEIGSVPGIQLASQDSNNRVLGSRLNSVFKACLLSSLCLTGELKHVD